MMNKTLFTAMLLLFWVAEFVFSTLVIYWFVTQGFASDDSAGCDAKVKLEDRQTTIRSLVIWISFFLFILLGIIIGA